MVPAHQPATLARLRIRRLQLALGLAAATVCLPTHSPVGGAEPSPPAVNITTGRPAPLAGKDYEQWTEARRGSQATLPDAIHVPAGFEVELLRSAQPGENSWVSLTLDSQGRVLIAKEGTADGRERGILRLTLPKTKGEAATVESIDDTLQECRGLLCAFGSLYARCNKASTDRPTGLYRLRDTDGDDRYDEVKLLRAEPGGGHGLNDLTLGPDNRLYLIAGDDSKLPPDWQPSESHVRHFGNDQLFVDLESGIEPKFERPPPGHLVRTDAEGKSWEVLACGLRNPYGIDFNTDGELFTYDADMELHVGLPCYRPTHLEHLVPGVDYGWRTGARPWPLYYPDRPPVSLPLGLGSPTAVKFGTTSNFPDRYRRALFILDWAYGRILAIHMRPQGASYDCTAEEFIDGRPLNVTDLDFGPDGAMYFITGGRQTQSGLYRLRYVGTDASNASAGASEPTADDAAASQANATSAKAARALRRQLESCRGRSDDLAIPSTWPHLGSPDPWIRCAARIAIEVQPIEKWQTLALSEADPTAALTALMALARCGDKTCEPKLLARLAHFSWPSLSDEQRMILLRTYELTFIRLGEPDAEMGASIARQMNAVFPCGDIPLDRELCQLLVYLHAPDVVAKTVPLAAATESQADCLLFLESLRNVTNGWTRASTLTYFQTLAKVKAARGGAGYPKYVKSIETAAMARLSAGERLPIAAILQPAAAEPAAPLPPRAFVKDWTMADLGERLKLAEQGRNFQRGEAMFAAATCKGCHQVGNNGTLLGPDLTSVSRRFGPQDILRSIIEPSLALDDKYRPTVVTTGDGRTITGVLVDEDEHVLVLSPNVLAAETVRIAKTDIEERRLSAVSPMPVGLLSTLSEDEILDLLAYIVSGGNASHASFRAAK
jgi:putative heme-binding domain-containing protein